jgi:hypothetical protein
VIVGAGMAKAERHGTRFAGRQVRDVDPDHLPVNVDQRATGVSR